MRNNLIYIYVFYYFFILMRTLLSRKPFFPCYRKYREMWHQLDEKVLNQTQGLTSAQWLPEGSLGPGNTWDCVQRSLGSFFFHSHKVKSSPAVKSLGPAICIHNPLFNSELQNPWHPLILSYLRTSDFNLRSKNRGPRLTASLSSHQEPLCYIVHAFKWTEIKVASGSFSSLAFCEHGNQFKDALNPKLRVQPCGWSCQSLSTWKQEGQASAQPLDVLGFALLQTAVGVVGGKVPQLDVRFALSPRVLLVDCLQMTGQDTRLGDRIQLVHIFH